MAVSSLRFSASSSAVLFTKLKHNSSSVRVLTVQPRIYSLKQSPMSNSSSVRVLTVQPRIYSPKQSPMNNSSSVRVLTVQPRIYSPNPMRKVYAMAKDESDPPSKDPFSMKEKFDIPQDGNSYDVILEIKKKDAISSSSHESNATEKTPSSELTTQFVVMKHAMRVLNGMKHLVSSLVEDDLKSTLSIRDVISFLQLAAVSKKYPQLALLGPFISGLVFLFKLYTLSLTKEEEKKADK